MEAALRRNRPEIEVELIGGHRGIFDVYRDDVLIFSKHDAHRFPGEAEILSALQPAP